LVGDSGNTGSGDIAHASALSSAVQAPIIGSAASHPSSTSPDDAPDDDEPDDDPSLLPGAPLDPVSASDPPLLPLVLPSLDAVAAVELDVPTLVVSVVSDVVDDSDPPPPSSPHANTKPTTTRGAIRGTMPREWTTRAL
jgi:hypothetical protein